jgi:hypothetical protein
MIRRRIERAQFPSASGPQGVSVTLFGGSKEDDRAMQYQGLGGLIVLIADVWAIVNIFQSGADTGKKVIWTVVVILLPVLGFIVWFFVGPRTGRA